MPLLPSPDAQEPRFRVTWCVYTFERRNAVIDPRRDLEPGSYQAAVTKVNEGWIKLPNGDPARGIISIEYSLPHCGDWRYGILDDSISAWGERAPQSFLESAARTERFEFVKEPYIGRIRIGDSCTDPTAWDGPDPVSGRVPMTAAVAVPLSHRLRLPSSERGSSAPV